MDSQMIACPYCGSENTEGTDVCNDCQHSLTDLDHPALETPVERGLMKDRIEALTPKAPLTVAPQTSIGEVLSQMTAASIGCVMIVEGDELLGIFSEFDAVRKVNVDAAQLADRPISSVMTPAPITLEAKDKIAFALHKMHVGGYRHLPIMTKGKLSGVVSIRDILNYLSERIGVRA
ncbi:MAG: CBS domain-containing protein [Planctomycetes bacterium]|nr:CBS domain-containing protein [Planctomycetota bacterium]